MLKKDLRTLKETYLQEYEMMLGHDEPSRLLNAVLRGVRENCVKIAVKQMKIAHNKGLTYEDIADAIRRAK